MINPRIGRLVFGLAIVSALASGATQAVASPGAKAKQTTYCENWPQLWPCHQYCQSMGYDRGYCGGPYDDCHCYNI